MTRLLVIGAVWPEPRSSAAGAHILQVIRPLLRLGWDVTYASTAAASRYAADLAGLGVSTVQVKVNDSSFDDLLDSLRPEVVVFDRFYLEEQFGWRVARHSPNALRILNTEDLHLLRDARERAHRKGDAGQTLELRNTVARREVAAILRSDLSLIISSFEMELLATEFEIPRELIHYCPFMLEAAPVSPSAPVPPFEARSNFFCVGNFRHPPNWDAVQWMKSEIWPRVRRELPEAQLRIAGSYASQDQMNLHEPRSGFLMEGRIDDADASFRAARICLAPLRFGAGLKGKLIDAMRNGTPSVTTPIGAEGLFEDSSACGVIGLTAAAIAAAAVRLHSNELEWNRAQASGFRVLEERFDRAQHEPILIQRIENARENLVARRGRNFMGAILRDQHHRSTQYLSLWIEERNKRSSPGGE